MNMQLIKPLILLIAVILLAGCVSSPPDTSVPVQQSASPAPIQTITGAAQSTQPDQSVLQVSTQNTEGSPTSIPPVGQVQPSSTTSPKGGKATTMEAFVTDTFQPVTEQYVAIKNSRNALEWKEVQDKALQLQVLIQGIKQDYQLTITNPEKRVFPALDSRQQIVFLKYLQSVSYTHLRRRRWRRP